MICQTNFAFWPFPNSLDIPAISYVLKFELCICKNVDIVCITQVLEAEDIGAVMYILGAPHRMRILIHGYV